MPEKPEERRGVGQNELQRKRQEKTARAWLLGQPETAKWLEEHPEHAAFVIEGIADHVEADFQKQWFDNGATEDFRAVRKIFETSDRFGYSDINGKTHLPDAGDGNEVDAMKILQIEQDATWLYSTTYTMTPINSVLLREYIVGEWFQRGGWFEYARTVMQRTPGAPTSKAAIGDRLTKGEKGEAAERGLSGCAIDEALVMRLLYPWERLNAIFTTNRMAYSRHITLCRHLHKAMGSALADPAGIDNDLRERHTCALAFTFPSSDLEDAIQRGCQYVLEHLFVAHLRQLPSGGTCLQLVHTPSNIADMFPFTRESLADIGWRGSLSPIAWESNIIEDAAWWTLFPADSTTTTARLSDGREVPVPRLFDAEIGEDGRVTYRRHTPRRRAT